MEESEGCSYGTHHKKNLVALAQCKKPICNKHLHHTCQGDCMLVFSTSIDVASLKLCCNFFIKEYGKEERSEDANEEISEDTSMLSAPLNTEIVSMINPETLEHSNETNERNQDASIPSL